MEFPRNNTQPADGRTSVVTGPTLSETFKLVRQEFGPDAVIAGSRTNTRRKSNGWGTEQVVEVLVQNPGAFPVVAEGDRDPEENLTGDIRREVERLEKMVEEICKGDALADAPEKIQPANPLGEYLEQNGASPGAVTRLLNRFAGETGSSVDDRPAAIRWLASRLDTVPGDLTAPAGIHAFLTEHAGDRLDLVLHLARRMTDLGRRVLVLSILPDPETQLPRLRAVAAASGHDAAVVQDLDQLADLQQQLDGYDLILMDLPALADPALGEGTPLHKWLAADVQVQRHLQVPMDRDFLDLADLREAARLWNCDSLALARLDGTRRPAKLLDLIDTIPLPVSLLADSAMGSGYLEAATPDLLLDRILALKSGPNFKPGLEIESA